jgi:hypothetical protein
MKTLGMKDAASLLGKTEGRIRQILSGMTKDELDELDIYKNSSGWQIPTEAVKFLAKERRENGKG